MFIKIVDCDPSIFNEEPLKQKAITNLITSSGERLNIIYARNNTLDKITQSDLYSRCVKDYAEEIKDRQIQL